METAKAMTCQPFSTSPAAAGTVGSLPTILAVPSVLPVLPVLNVAAYRFVDVDDPGMLRDRLFGSAHAAGLLGTVLVAPEGINLFLAGQATALREWLAALRQDARFRELEAKKSFGGEVPFRRMRVRLEREIVCMNLPAVRPASARAPAVDAATLARWLAAGRCDKGRPLAMLDTRNGFEVDAGAFAGASDWRLRQFSDFPAALAARLQSSKARRC